MHKLVLAALLAAVATGAPGQDHMTHGTATPDLPPACLADAGMNMGGTVTDGMGAMPAGGDAAHADLMDGMGAMNADMMAGGAATDIDVAFICAMIPHHRGAIDMAKAELAHGDDPWARTLAEQIIAAQEKEIAEMIAWLGQQK